MAEQNHAHGELATLTWGLFLLLALAAIFIAMGFPAGPFVIIGSIAGLLFAFRSIYLAFYLGVALTPFLGILVSIPTGALLFGQRAFGGSVDVSLAEAILFFVLCAWALKLVFLWWKRRDQNWHPRLPAAESYILLFLAHLASVFSPLLPDPVLVMKFALRPVLFDYLAFIALPVNLIRSRKRLLPVLAVVSAVGLFAAFNGLVSIFFPSSGGFLGRAHPFPIFGIGALGENHNELAEILVVTTMFTFALAELVKDAPTKRLLRAAALFQCAIGLLTFTRTAWIVFALQVVVLFATEWRETVKKNLSTVCLVLALLFPLGVGMAAYSVSQTAQSSNSTRLMLTQIALQLYESSPWVGSGAGTFLERLGSTRVFLVEYGDPLDSHGFIQKIAAETGTFGLIALFLVCFQIGTILWQGRRGIVIPTWRRAFILIIAGAGGAFIYQLFNTAYWSGVLWLPVGIALASVHALKDGHNQK